MTPDRARQLVHIAIKRGQLIRPALCGKCGQRPRPTIDGRPNIHGHHHDYDKPLDVEWLCAKCHRAVTPLPAIMGAPNFGEKNAISKLTDKKVIFARALRAQGKHSYAEIARLLGVNKSTAIRAITGQLWKHVAAPVQPGEAG